MLITIIKTYEYNFLIWVKSKRTLIWRHRKLLLVLSLNSLQMHPNLKRNEEEELLKNCKPKYKCTLIKPDRERDLHSEIWMCFQITKNK